MAHTNGRSDLEVVFDDAVMNTDFEVHLNDAAVPGVTWTVSTDNREDNLFEAYDGNDGTLTGKDNFITLSTTSTDFRPKFDDKITLVFKASDDVYITNPGSDEFFVKIDTFDSADSADHVRAGVHNIDGGVTVANVMTESIHITTKVLETMSFSVGVDNPDMMVDPEHGSCDAMQVDSVTQNRLNLGNPNAEYSLETGQAFDVHSYWRLSSNSSGGATVYYSGDTLRNTVGDKIASIEAEAGALSRPGTEQFGLALVDIPVGDIDGEAPYANFPVNHPIHQIIDTESTRTWIDPLNIVSAYANGNGRINVEVDAEENTLPINASFKFVEDSKSIPEMVARNTDQVVSCATSKVRYIGNIAADTPAGVYTTKINFLAAPQY